MARVTAKQAPATAYDICATRFILMRHSRIQFVPNAASMRGFVVEAEPQRKSRRRAWPC